MYLFLFKMGGAEATFERIANDVPLIKETVDSVSRNESVFLLRSDDSATLAYLFVSGLNAGQLKAAFDSCKGIYSRDDFIILQVGADFSATQSFSRVTTFLQHHSP